MYTCANCTVHACEKGVREKKKKNCPMNKTDHLTGILKNYMEPETNRFSLMAASMEAEGYGVWPRLKEIIEFCKRMGYQKVGMAFCGGLKEEARIVADIFRKHGINLISVICKVGGFDKSEIGMNDSHKVHPGEFEPMCNPITQAELLNQEGTEFNIILGLCAGDERLFGKRNTELITSALISL